MPERVNRPLLRRFGNDRISIPITSERIGRNPHPDKNREKGGKVPFKSAKQRRFMFARHPKIAKRWARKYGTKPRGKRRK